MHRYTINIVAKASDQNETDIILHWSCGRKTASEWSRPDDNLLPVNSTRFAHDVNVVQSVFERSLGYPEYASM